MHRFEVWAPRVHTISVKVGDMHYPLEARPHGWWQTEVVTAGHGTDYAFLLDEDAKLYPDPRSGWQPNGVHQASRVVDYSLFEWKDERWQPPALSEAIIYELHIGTFTQEGTFVAAASKLPALRELGITHVEVMPVNSFPGRWGWGYDGVAIYAPQEQYGGPDGLKLFVDACHSNGLAAVLDVVYNHFGPVGNYTGQFGPYITSEHHTPWGGAVNLEAAGSDEVRRFFCDNALMWLRDYHFDGLRLDAVQAFVDRSAKHFIEQLAEEVGALSHQLGRELVLIAESDLNDPRVVTSRALPDDACAGGYGMDAQWSDDFHHSLFAFLTGQRQRYYQDFGELEQVAKALTSAYVYDGIYSEHRDRCHGRSVQSLSAHRFLGYIQNHDQVGNQPHGERLHVSAGIDKAKLAAALVLTAPFIPMIFQGEEFAASSPFLYFVDHEDPELARAVSLGRRREHAHEGDWDSIPDPGMYEAVASSTLNWRERDESPHREMLLWYRDLIRLRRSHARLRDGDFASVRVRFDANANWLVMERSPIHLYFNFGEGSLTLCAPPNARLLLASQSAVGCMPENIQLPPRSFAAVTL